MFTEIPHTNKNLERERMMLQISSHLDHGSQEIRSNAEKSWKENSNAMCKCN